MNRLPTLACFGLMLVWPAIAAADTMDPALSRLRFAGCGQMLDHDCPNQEWFERLASEYAVAMATPLTGTARSVGPRGFFIGLDTTVTAIDAGQTHWLRGTEGDGDEPENLMNASPSTVLVWNRAEVRKGLPFGFEVGSSLAQGIDTSLWTAGVQLKWSLVEGFHSGLGQLPDVAVRGTWTRSFGSNQLAIELWSADLLLSKPFVVEHSLEISPLIGAQLLIVNATTGVVDLTPDVNAFEDCLPSSVREGELATDCNAGSSPGDFRNDVMFDEVDQERVRITLGARVRYAFVVAGATLMFDLSRPTIEAEPPVDDMLPADAAAQVAFNFSLGAIL